MICVIMLNIRVHPKVYHSGIFYCTNLKLESHTATQVTGDDTDKLM